MKAGRMLRWLGAPSTILGCACAMAMAEFTVLLHYECVLQEDCGLVSQVCWASSHPWGSNNCTYCDGTEHEDLCQKAHNLSCNWVDTMQGCGTLWNGTCKGSGYLGNCSNGTPLPDEPPCSVPEC